MIHSRSIINFFFLWTNDRIWNKWSGQLCSSICHNLLKAKDFSNHYRLYNRDFWKLGWVLVHNKVSTTSTTKCGKVYKAQIPMFSKELQQKISQHQSNHVIYAYDWVGIIKIILNTLCFKIKTKLLTHIQKKRKHYLEI